MTHAAAIDAIVQLNRDPGDEILLEVQRISSGGTVVAYGYDAGHLVAAGPMLGFGGDAATAGTFDCLAGSPPRVVVRGLDLLGPTIYGWWRETKLTYAWKGPRLVRVSKRTFRRHGGLTRADYAIGRGCLRGIG